MLYTLSLTNRIRQLLKEPIADMPAVPSKCSPICRAARRPLFSSINSRSVPQASDKIMASLSPMSKPVARLSKSTDLLSSTATRYNFPAKPSCPSLSYNSISSYLRIPSISAASPCLPAPGFSRQSVSYFHSFLLFRIRNSCHSETSY